MRNRLYLLPAFLLLQGATSGQMTVLQAEHDRSVTRGKLAQRTLRDHSRGPEATSKPDTVPSELVVHTTLRPPNQDIYLVERTGAEPRRVTEHPALDFNATFSPDGRWLVFTSGRGGNTDLYALALEEDGEPFRLTRSLALDDAADVSPDGERLVFVSTRDGNADIFAMPFAPGDPTAESRAVNLTRHPADDFNPAVSPDGSVIAWARRDGPVTDWRNRFLTGVFLMASDGSGPRPLADGPGTIAGSPAWAAEGDLLYLHGVHARGTPLDSVYVRRGWTYRIWSAKLDGSEWEPVTSTDHGALAPTVHPGGGVAFNRTPAAPPLESSELEQSRTVQFVDVEGANLQTVVDSSSGARCLAPAFGPDGQLACHGPVPERVSYDQPERRGSAGTLSRRQVDLPDRTLEVIATRGYFPDFLQEDRIVFGEGLRAGVPLVTATIDGDGRRQVYRQEDRQPWASTTCRDGSWVAFSEGPTFAAPDEDVDIWSRTLAFRSGRSGDKEIYLMDADGGGVERLTHREGVETTPDISPDGQWIAFSTDRDGAGMKVWIQRLDGSDGRFLEPDRAGEPGIDMHPEFSPDGEWIVVVSDRGGMSDEFVLSDGPQPYGDLWAIPVAGGEAVRLTDDRWEDGLPRWGFSSRR